MNALLKFLTYILLSLTALVIPILSNAQTNKLEKLPIVSSDCEDVKLLDADFQEKLANSGILGSVNMIGETPRSVSACYMFLAQAKRIQNHIKVVCKNTYNGPMQKQCDEQKASYDSVLKALTVISDKLDTNRKERAERTRQQNEQFEAERARKAQEEDLARKEKLVKELKKNRESFCKAEYDRIVNIDKGKLLLWSDSLRNISLELDKGNERYAQYLVNNELIKVEKNSLLILSDKYNKCFFDKRYIELESKVKSDFDSISKEQQRVISQASSL